MTPSSLGTIALTVLLAAGLTGADSKPYGISKRVPWTSSRVVGSPEPPSPYTTELAFPALRFQGPTEIVAAPGTSRLFVAEREGRILSFPNDPGAAKADLFLDLGPGTPDPRTGRLVPRQIMGLAFHPEFARNGYVYVFLSENLPAPRRTRIARFQSSRGDPPQADPRSESIILEYPSAGHNGGCLRFGPDGYLYIAVGDGGGQYDPHETGQFLGDLLSSILRIDVNRTHSAKLYAVPPDNPFLNTPGAMPEIWAFGFRQPWKMSFDRATGDLWAGEVGQDLWESIYLVRKGGNYGWSVTEGPQAFRANGKKGPEPVLPPVIAHSHAESRSITGGYVYRGKRWKELYGAYVYADWETGKIWALRQENGKVTWHQELDDTSLDIAAFGEDHEGELYMLTHNDARIHRLAARPTGVRDTSADFPRLLSQTGLFESVKDLRPAPGLIPYSVNSPLWSDGAEKERFLAIPGDGRIQYASHDQWLFPTGSVLVKTFFLEMEKGNPASRRRLETRLLTLQPSDAGREQWAGYTYLWNDSQTDAELLGRESLQKTYKVRDQSAPGGEREQTWYYPSRTDCMICHNEKARFVLGLNSWQMNREHDYGGVRDNQLRTLAHIGAFHRPLAGSPETLPRLPDPHDESAALEQRARSYLHANCAHCHQHGGGGNADFRLLYTLPIEKTFLLGAEPMHGAVGADDARLLVAGDPERSVLYRRMATAGSGRMPHIGTLEVDEAAVKLVREWVTALR